MTAYSKWCVPSHALSGIEDISIYIVFCSYQVQYITVYLVYQADMRETIHTNIPYSSSTYIHTFSASARSAQRPTNQVTDTSSKPEIIVAEEQEEKIVI